MSLGANKVNVGYTVTKTQIKIELKKVGHTLALYFLMRMQNHNGMQIGYNTNLHIS